jgi:serine/threonine protein kinase
MYCRKCGANLPGSSVPCPNCGAQSQLEAQQSATGARAPANDPYIGSVIDQKYRIESKIGAGGMATVYRATRLLIGDIVAVKILHPEQLRDPKTAERFRREAQAAARLKHPNAVTIHDFGISENGTVFLVMEFVEGQSLRSIIKEQGPFTPSAAAEIISQVCGALDEAHRQNIVHRDIKPDNVIANVHAEGIRVKVLDFGIARMRDISALNLTQTGSVMGTPHYMSPEQCMGEELDCRSDIYSLGIVLYEMLAGVVPFNSPTSTAVIIQHVNQAPPPLRVLNVSISAGVETVVLHALAKRREERPQSAKLLAEELTTAVGGGIFPVQGTTAVIPATGTSLAVTPGLAPTIQMPTPTWGITPAQPVTRGELQVATPVTVRHRKVWPAAIMAAVAVVAIGLGGAWILSKRGSANKAVQIQGSENPPGSGSGSPSPTGASSGPASTPQPPGNSQQVPAPPPDGRGNSRPNPNASSTNSGTIGGGLPTPSPSAPSTNARLNIKSTPGGAWVRVDDKPVGNTETASGFLSVPLPGAGGHFVTIGANGYQQTQQSISVAPGASQVIEVTLVPLPGKLNVHPSVSGASIEIVGVGTFSDQVSDRPINPGKYEIRVSKRGYQPVARTVDIQPGQPENIEIPMEPVPTEELLGVLQRQYEVKNYDEVIRGGRDLIANQSGNARLNFLLGLSYFGKGNYSESLPYLSKAIDLGETVTFPIKHHHRGDFGLGDDLCEGEVIFKKGALEFHSTNRRGEDFSILSAKLYEVRSEPTKSGRVSIDVGISKGNKDEKKTYNFHSTQAGIRLLDPNNPQSLHVLFCNNCQPMMDVFYKLMMKEKQ